MAAVEKFNQVVGYLIKEEAANGTAETLDTAADGATCYIGDGDPRPPESLEYVFDGKIGNSPGSLAPQKRTTPNGRFRKGQFQCLPKGAGTAYSSSSVVPPNEVHRWLVAAGYTATFSTDHWEYTPSAHGAFKSFTVRQYAHGELWEQAGVIADFSYDSSGLGVPIWTFDYAGNANKPTTQALPAITYQATGVIPPVASAVVGSIGDFDAAVIRKVMYKRNRSIDTARINQQLAGGHAGFVPGRTMPTFEIELEKEALVSTPFHTSGGLDADSLMAAATSVTVTIAYTGGTANNWDHEFTQAQLVNVAHSNDGPLATYTLTFAAHASTPSANDAEIITFY